MEQVLLLKQNTKEASNSYVPSGTNVLQQIFKEHFKDFVDNYEEKYSIIYGKYRLDRITEVVEEFLKCGDYKEGIARVKCTNPECGHDYFVPLSCLCFYLCLSAMNRDVRVQAKVRLAWHTCRTPGVREPEDK